MQNRRLYLSITSTFLSFQIVLMIGLFVQLNRSEKNFVKKNFKFQIFFLFVRRFVNEFVY